MSLFQKTLLVFGVLLGLLVAHLAAPTVQAQAMGPLCDDRKDMLTALDGKFDEKPVSLGLAGNGTVVVVLISENGSWTIIMTSTNGVSCLMATGEHWRELPKQKAELAL
jgi:hypothetical protein